MSEYHNPVLLEQSVTALVTNPDGVYADATFGGGGHKLASGCKITGDYEEAIDKLVVAIGKYLDD